MAWIITPQIKPVFEARMKYKTAFEAKELGARSSFARPVGVRGQVCRLRGKAIELSHFLLLGDDDSALFRVIWV